MTFLSVPLSGMRAESFPLECDFVAAKSEAGTTATATSMTAPMLGRKSNPIPRTRRPMSSAQSVVCFTRACPTEGSTEMALQRDVGLIYAAFGLSRHWE